MTSFSPPDFEFEEAAPVSVETPLEDQEHFAALLSADEPDLTEAPQEAVQVIPLNATGDWTVKVGPPSAAKAAEGRFARRAIAGVTLSPGSQEALFLAALDPTGVADEKIKRQRVSNGWLYRIDDVRMFTTMVNLSPSNDRLLADAVYAADPEFTNATSGLHAVPMPTSHPRFASLIYSCDRAVLREASDLNMDQVSEDNPIDVGSRIIEQPITLVTAAFALGLEPDGSPSFDEDAPTQEEYVAVDGNSRCAAGFKNITFPVRLLPQRLHALYGSPDSLVTLRPSLLNQMTHAERRDLTRKLFKLYSDVYAALRTKEATKGALSDSERRAKNTAAKALNSLTVPATVIVGYIDDDPALHVNQRFATAVREVLQGMNVAPKAFGEGARSGVSAEQAVVALYEANLLGPQSATSNVAESTRDTLIGRTPSASAMAALGLTPTADLRAAVVVREFTRPGPDVTRVLRVPLNVSQIHLKHRAGPVVELALRGYTASRDHKQVDSMRKVLSSGSGGCLWQGLLRTPWEVVDVATDDHVDDLAEVALRQLKAAPALPQGALCLLGVLGMIALVSGGYLLAAGGSAENVAANLENVAGRVGVQRGSVGSVVEDLLEREWGIRLLADAIKRARSGGRPRLIDPESGKFVELPSDHGTAEVNATLRRMLKKDNEPDVEDLTHADKQRRALNEFSQAVVETKDVLRSLLELHSDPRDKIPFMSAQGALMNLEAITDNFKSVVAPRPLDFS
ncbi:hypothetical protein [Paractinoplanes toevensis]|uniref:Uncharacterized protein n=1 Tax=Paractinoplanes toevensis TaxID=571911 RepID=A0A919W474_9ACTN|nr:hypothetical protein [Actinoplanes toevensis]GIM95627.1 hypothetical protein Ato02nite_074200 [Actinoplanes toevensis]